MEELSDNELFKDCEDEQQCEIFQEKLEKMHLEEIELDTEDIEDSLSDESTSEYYLDNYQTGGHKSQSTTNRQQVSTKQYDYQSSDKLLHKYYNKINLDPFEKMEKRIKDKKSRATAEKALDPRTRMILYQLLRRQVISEIDGCICSGKEANVYHANSVNGHYAVKVYKTSILDFKDRSIYIAGEFRNRSGHCRKNPRKMVRTWAEKEIRNLHRMYTNGLPVPKPVILKSNVLVMEFIGWEHVGAPQLRNVRLTNTVARKLYGDIIRIMWKLYNKCKLVHADLSEFNLLYHNGELYMIDVSQSVEHDHPHALEFLRRDCVNINNFFNKFGVATLNLKDFFDFITDPSITDANMEECAIKYCEKAANEDWISSDEVVNQSVFKDMYIPSRLTEVIDFERDIIKVKSGTTTKDDLIYKTLIGLKSDLSGVVVQPEILRKNENESENTEFTAPTESEINETDSEDRTTKEACLDKHSKPETSEENKSDKSESDEESESDSEDESSTKELHLERRPKHETVEEKKARKKAVKEAKAEKRKTKIKKHVKKRNEKKTKK